MRRKPFVTFVAAMAVTLMVLFSIERTRRSAGRLGTTRANVEDNVAPDFTLQSIDGKIVRFSDFRGKAVLLNFWATYRAPCRIEMPWFVELQNRYGSEGLQVVGVAMDDASPNDIESLPTTSALITPFLSARGPWATHSVVCSSCLPRFILVASARWWIRCSV
jgi:thiol-disulfide isomerase/thioredoxin